MNTVIKINSKIEKSELDKVLSKCRQLEGVIGVKVDNNFLTYDLDTWASDYDVMVAIMNFFDEIGVDTEPLFEGAEEMVKAVNGECHCHEHEHEEEHCCCHHEHEHEEEHCCCHHEHEHEKEHCCCHHEHEREEEHCCCHDDKGGVSFCGCGSHDNVDKTDNKTKFIELSISAIILVVGVILSNIQSTVEFAKYVLIVSFAISGYEVVIDAFASIFKKKPFTECTLMMIASIAAMFLGEMVEAAGIMLLYNVGDTFERVVTIDANKIINALKSYKKEKVRILGDGDIEIETTPDKVKVNDVIILRAGEKLAVDGVIIDGSSSFDTKVITGESAYKDLSVGCEVLGGYVSVDGTVKIKATKIYEESAVYKIAKIVEQASKKKSKSEKFLEKFAKWYTPTIVISALIIAFIPPFFSAVYLSGLKVWGLRAVMLLCVSCPCSIVISIPLAYFMGVANLAKRGVIVKNSATLEKLSNVSSVVYDKTGTLTEGVLTITKVVSTKKYQGKVLELVATCEKHSNHPIAQAILQKANALDGEISDYLEVAGKGISCTFDGKKLICGNGKFLTEQGVKLIDCNHLGTKLYLAVDGECAGVIVLNDKIRATARGSILELYDCGVENTVMLTGDNKDYAVSVRKQLNMNKSASELLPEDKVVELEKIMSETDKNVVFVGDGVNDAPVITRADVGVAMGGIGSDAAVNLADVILTTDDLSKVPYSIKVAKRTSLISKQNLIGSLSIKFLVVILSVFGITSSLWLAIGADVGLLVVTIFNAIRNKFDAI